MSNPTKFSNWLISSTQNRGGLIVGEYPHDKPDVLPILLKSRIDVFVNLCRDNEIKKYGDYSKRLNPKTKYYNFPIRDGHITSDLQVKAIVFGIIAEIEKGNLVYLHCLGGHGRAGTISALVISHIFKFDAETSLSVVKKYHQTRERFGDRPTPQTYKQYLQVRRLAAKV